MKKIIMLLSVGAAAALFALPVMAQDPCSTDGKIALYGEFYKERKGDQSKAYEAAKKYVACPADTSDPDEPKRIEYLKDFVTKYEKQDRITHLTNLINTKKYADAFPAGKDILNDQPDNVGVVLDLVFAGYSSGIGSLDADTVAYAKRAIQLLESGKAPEKWERFRSKDDALAWCNYTIATRAAAKSSFAEAIPYFIKAASYESSIKKLPITYSALGEAYEKGPYAKLSADYKAKYEGKDETPESKLALENINQVVDRMIDAYARAVALATNPTTDAEIKAKSAALDAVTFYYKSRHEKSDGLNDMIAGILSKPLPPEPTPITSLPTPPATPVSGPGTSGTNPGAGSPSTTPKTAGPTKPKMHRAHIQG